MSADPESENSYTPYVYRVTVGGRLNLHWQNWFGNDFTMGEYEGHTVLVGSIVDQSSLHGLIRKIRDLGVPLISVVRLNEEGDEEK